MLATALTRADLDALRGLMTRGAPSAIAASLVDQYGGWRMTQRRVVDDKALVTLVSDAGERAVLRVGVKDGVAAEIEAL